jgi:endonuclease/exonuclease/phosphatase family metal-dependent hydrolase
VADVLQGFRPDAVALQEVRRGQARRLAGRLGFHWYWVLKHYPYTPLLWWRAEGMAVLSPHELADRFHGEVSVGQSVWTFRRRIRLAVTVHRGGEALRVHDLHLEGTVPARVEQARRAAAELDAVQPCVVAGDLNAAHDPDTVGPFLGLGLKDPGGADTSTATNPTHRVDYVLVPEEAVVRSTFVPPGGPPWDLWSDHLPLVVEFELPQPRARVRSIYP